MHTIQFMPAAEKDADTIIELRRKVWETTYRGIYPDSMLDAFDFSWHLQKELQRIRHPQYDVYLITQNGRGIGYLTMRKTEAITLQSLYVLKEYQRRGIGKLAFDFVRQYCQDHQKSSFVCHCVPENYPARKFYEKMGGKIVGEDMDNEESWMNSVIYRFDFS